MRATSSMEVPYWAALRARFDWGVPSGAKGVCPTVVSPMTMPASFMYQSDPEWMPPGKVCITVRRPRVGTTSRITSQWTPL